MSVDLKVPSLGESVREASIEKWLKKEGDFVKRDEPVVSLESDKANVEVPAPVGGILKQVLKTAGAKVAIGEVLARIEPATMRLSRQAVSGTPLVATPEAASILAAVTTPSKATPRAAIVEAPRVDAPPPAPQIEEPHVPPSVRRMAREQGIDLAKLAGTGPGGAILPSDVRAPSEVKPTSSKDGRAEERVPMTSLRKKIAERLVEGRNKAAILSTFNECDLSRVMALREEHKEKFQQKHGVKLGFMSFFVKAAIEALKAFPAINSEIQGEEVVYRNYYDIGVAVGSGKGLVVPVIRNAETLSFAELEKTIEEFGKKAKENKLLPDDLAGGTFTISNGGIYGSLLSTPLLNPPQSGILGMHAIQKRPVAVGDQVVVRPMMYVALSYDHRIVDGREAVQFLVRVKECIESPDRILLEV
ncbi:MAG TPA: 2-oxoglutarate dehydrogenase complex dihydrolipoyllysine-residue succinyltransferase [Planctomycetota bacterium]|nr:2-oxoglutarate dehydrogenase complex dihydrolipoyllysine-residue succinyltransferase [Planctomycetota bacterium]